MPTSTSLNPGSSFASPRWSETAKYDTWDGDPAAYLRQDDAYVEGMFGGGKAELRPIFEKLAAAVRKLGREVKVCPCKTIVPFYRSRVFAQAKMAT